MSSIEPGYLIKLVRLRKAMTQPKLLEESGLENLHVFRLEHERHRPDPVNLQVLMDTLDIQMGEFLIPLLENQPDEVIAWRDRLICALDRGDIEQAEEIFKLFDTLEGFEEGINRQFIVSHKARYLEQIGAPAYKILPLIEEGMNITFPEYQECTVADAILIFEESELLHTKARILFKDGKTAEAINLLENIRSGLSKLPVDDCERERQLGPVLLTLTSYQLQTKDYASAYEASKEGARISYWRKQGKYMPDFLLARAQSYHGLGLEGRSRSLLMSAFFGYSLVRDSQKNENALTLAKELGISFNTYNAEKLASLPRPREPYNRGEIVACANIGEFILKLRKKANLTLDQLCQGIYSVGNLSKIEKNMITGNVYGLEGIMQRLGRHIDYYLNTFLSGKDFDEKQMRDKIIALAVCHEYDAAEALLNELESKRTFQKGICLQFVKKMHAILYGAKNGPTPEGLQMLREALQITWPNFDESDQRNVNSISQRPLAYYEISILNQIAMHYRSAGDFPHAAKLYERLRDSMDNSYVDELEKARMYGALLYNYSKTLAQMARYEEALVIIEDGVNFELRGRRLQNLPDFAINKALCLLEMGRTEESIPYFAQAYYGASMFADFGGSENMAVIQEYVMERLGICFD
ncbi:MAG: hypothetical protein FWE42_07055 [Defluviitaleaceae bacterium]|nr:hypothetical protein [Defluviitaleaceae bacterium]